MQELAERRARPPERYLLVAVDARRLKLAYHRREDMAVLCIVVVAGPVEVRRHEGMVDKPPLASKELAELEPRDLRERISLVRLLKLRGEKRRLGDRLRRHARIDARRTKEKKPLDASLGGGPPSDEDNAPHRDFSIARK